MLNLKKIRSFIKNRKQLFSFGLICSLLVCYISYKSYLKYKKKHRKLHYDKWFFSPESNPSHIDQVKLSSFLSNLKYKLLLSFSPENKYAGKVKISFFLSQSHQKALFLDFNGQSIYEIEINNKNIDTIVFEHHQIHIPKALLHANARNTITLKFFSIYTYQTEGLWHMKNQNNSAFHQIFTIFPFITKAIFPCFLNFDLKFRVKMAFLIPELNWDLISVCDIKSKMLVSGKQGLKVIEKVKGFDLFFNRSISDYNLFLYEETHSIPLYLMNFALGSFASIEIPLTKGILLKILINPNYKANFGLLQRENLIRRGFCEIEGFFQRKYPWNRVELAFVDFSFVQKGLGIPFMFFDEELVRFPMNERKKILWFYSFLQKICQVYTRTLCRISKQEELAFLAEFEGIIAFKVLLSLIPEAILYRDILIKRTGVNSWLEFIYDLIGERSFKETLMSFFSRTVIFALNQQEFCYCLKHILREKGIVLNSSVFTLYNEENKKVLLKGDYIRNDKGEKGFLIEFIRENKDDKINGVLEILLFYNDNSIKSINLSLFDCILPYLIEQNIESPETFMGFINSSNDFLMIGIDAFKKLECLFFILINYRIKSLIFLCFEQAIYYEYATFFENFLMFCLKVIEKEPSELIMERVLSSLIDVFERNLCFNDKTRYCNLIFDRILNRIEKTHRNQIETTLIPSFDSLLLVLYSKENLKLAINWLNDWYITINNYQIPIKNIEFHQYWLIMHRLFLSNDFSFDFKQEILTNTLTQPKYKPFNNEFQIITCNSAILTNENKEKIWKKSLLAEWKNKETFQYSTLFFYEGMDRDLLLEYGKKFFNSAEIVFISLPKDHSLILFKNLKVHRSIRKEFIKDYEELRNALEGVAKEWVEKEISEIKNDV